MKARYRVFRSVNKLAVVLIVVVNFLQSYPFAYAMMNRKTRDLYDLVMKRIIDVFEADFPGLKINIQRTMTDYESAIQGALNTAFADCECVGCYFHYCDVKPCFSKKKTVLLNDEFSIMLFIGDSTQSTETRLKGLQQTDCNADN